MIKLINDTEKIRQYYQLWENEVGKYNRPITEGTKAFLLKEEGIEKGMLAFEELNGHISIVCSYIHKPYRLIKNFTKLVTRLDKLARKNKAAVSAYIVTRVGIHRVFERLGYDVRSDIFPITARRYYG